MNYRNWVIVENTIYLSLLVGIILACYYWNPQNYYTKVAAFELILALVFSLSL